MEKSVWNRIKLGAATAAVIAATTFGVGHTNVNDVEAETKPNTGIVTKAPNPTFAPELPTATPTATVTTTATPAPTETPMPTATPTEVFTERETNGIRIFFDKQEIPVFYQLPGEEKIAFDREKMRLARERAQNENGSLLAAIVDIPDTETEDTYKPSEDRPLVEILPEDVADSTYLEERGIKIIQGEVELHIKKSAFEEGGPLADYVVGGERHLIVGMIDDPAFTPYSLDREDFESIRDIGRPAYESVKGEEIISPENFRTNELELIDCQLAEARENGFGDILIEYLNMSREIIQRANDKELKRMIADRHSNYGGLMVPSSMVQEYLGMENTSIVFVCTGNSFMKNLLVVEVDQQGKFDVQNINWSASVPGNYVSGRPAIGQSRPRRSDFTAAGLNPKSKYKTDDRRPGLTWQHELEHVIRMELSSTGDAEVDRNEEFTDDAAIERMQKSYDSGEYYFLLSVPGKDGGVRGYILTKNETMPERTDGAVV